MNYLAHAYLSFGQEEILVGNFIADFVKGKVMLDYPQSIRNGILLHREIDRFTDSHPLVRAGQSYLRPKFGHYSTVITDIFFDYFLGKNWRKFSDQPLENFIEETFQILERHSEQFPERFSKMFYWMRKDNWLLHYATLEGIQKSLTGLSNRTSFDSKMELAHLTLIERESEFELIFFAFFKDLETFTQSKLTEIQAQHDSH
ncbi:MAG: ACP phosphodiesterase [Algoriphagus sp.]|uniref:acyl carrier protein phosphodiesterase n=1 Tax=Algoriphagus sp. TaxID=1872435 RepID=UPI00261F8FFF|nr:ACP phosphodiesterase [Algoriphagus sp.]MDG1276813.1 ACP phosphodiesterase [Algoriphagus sp.]